ncbi:pilus assembly protein [Burkholderia vietnamiensis]|nr:pilus assembly protein [Burkholderia vietnamiensis]
MNAYPGSRESTVPAARSARPRAAQRGASLLEAISYLGVAAIVVIGAIALLNGAFNSASTNAVNEQVSAIQSGVKKLYMGQPGGYGNLGNSVLASAGVFPSTLTPSGDQNTVTNTWNGAVAVAGNGSTFTISYGNVPRSVCVNAVTAGGNWVSIAINGKTESTTPVSPDVAATDCSSDTANTIVWTST